jgi:hypothetical protein
MTLGPAAAKFLYVLATAGHRTHEGSKLFSLILIVPLSFTPTSATHIGFATSENREPEEPRNCADAVSGRAWTAMNSYSSISVFIPLSRHQSLSEVRISFFIWNVFTHAKNNSHCLCVDDVSLRVVSGSTEGY